MKCNTMQGPLFLEFNSKIKFGDQLKNLKNSWIYSLNSAIISRILKIVASQNKFQSPHDEIFNIERFLE